MPSLLADANTCSLDWMTSSHYIYSATPWLPISCGFCSSYFTHKMISLTMGACTSLSYSEHSFHMHIHGRFSSYKEDHSAMAGTSYINVQHWQRGTLIIVPNTADLRLRYIELHHNSPYPGHLGEDRTIDLILHHYWWPNIQADVIFKHPTLWCLPAD